MLIFILTSLLIIIIDQLTKTLVTQNLDINESRVLIPKVIELFYIHNDGAGWGLFSGQQVLFIVLTSLFILYLSIKAYNNRFDRNFVMIIYGLLMGGAIGNLMDRVQYGYVIDMLHILFIDFPIFNIADMALSLGVFFLILTIVLREDSDYLL